MRKLRRGYIATDAIMAVAIVVILSTVLAVAVSRQRRGSERLADSREAIRLAEATLTAMQSGAPVPAAPAGMTVQVRPVDAQPELAAPSGSAWVEVVVTHDGRSRGLTGIVRADAAKEAVK